MSGDELQLNGKLPPVVQYLDALTQLVEMHASGLEAVNLAHQEIVKLIQKLDQVVPETYEQAVTKFKQQ
jgi:hypothetical protein